MTHPQPPPDSAGRAEFEAWCRSEGWSDYALQRHPILGDYADHGLEARWIVWQAARTRPASPAAEPVAELVRDENGGTVWAWRTKYMPWAVGTKLYTHPAPPAPAGDELPRLARVARQIADGSQCINCKGIADEIDAALKDSGGGK